MTRLYEPGTMHSACAVQKYNQDKIDTAIAGELSKKANRDMSKQPKHFIESYQEKSDRKVCATCYSKLGGQLYDEPEAIWKSIKAVIAQGIVKRIKPPIAVKILYNILDGVELIYQTNVIAFDDEMVRLSDMYEVNTNNKKLGVHIIQMKNSSYTFQLDDSIRPIAVINTTPEVIALPPVKSNLSEMLYGKHKNIYNV